MLLYIFSVFLTFSQVHEFVGVRDGNTDSVLVSNLITKLCYIGRLEGRDGRRGEVEKKGKGK